MRYKRVQTGYNGMKKREVPELRLLYPNGSLVFPPFSNDQYRHDIHAAQYRCRLKSALGIVVSREVHVKAGTLVCNHFVYFLTTQCLTPEQEDMLRTIHKECEAVTGVTEEVGHKAIAGEIPPDASIKQHALCFAKKMGCHNEAGDVQVDKIRENLKLVIPDDAVVEDLIAKCVVQQATPEDTAFETAKCIYNMKLL
ncbi:hypothetical protein NQ318_003987 [Aromia moschata]|uniref:Uncharacterized protein n=1 Tax=Aromia moschata TaxID=1265417 RepID=A0AAV8Z8H2_9CUCU|nr:hypothetical protein NQ318_003987 [Aromia moschata]